MTSVRDEEAGRGQAAVPVQGGRRAGDEQGSGVVTAFGRQLKLLRIRAGLERTEFGKRMGYSADTVASIEQGRRIPQAQFIEKADEVLGAGGVLNALKEEVGRAQYPAFFRDMARLEARATALSVYAVYAVPGLLQTEDYARAIFHMQRPLLDDEMIEQRFEARMVRQEVLRRRPAPLMSFVIEEAVLRRPIGGPSVMRETLGQILVTSRSRNVEVQVMPIDREDNAALSGPFSLIDVDGGQRLAYAEVQDLSRLYTDTTYVRTLEARYGILRSQALTPSESVAFIEQLMGDT
ncbi:helix-turn-helix domain-containing protein [Streptomyces olivaceus]|uniref:helix-turn-helix domain-containing protein n=1 Tax=Streptomyces olivaceus TaxID=47716 RepID=UPI001CCB1F70|nr:helix-turn-helix transcriptional regulator [Streptomyces olivaceus]MBZ6196222.1 helix-turn-helix domain-containing protein [Streptomyces olivaceus]MBZ6282006.1 helix-turn-helix domain-containing protein [Streptomyces olivaceus]MBZ6295761.1 helix-turn-helix domain-containing protein [Streptomyces olivaceus]MBZ6330828.1 helix-turn-helix domain-containing protein [Streptomyces olivaceus]